jgi:hypothetical protein
MLASWSHEGVLFLDLLSSSHSVTSSLFPYLGSTDAPCSRLGDPVPPSPIWRPHSQGPRTLPYWDPEQWGLNKKEQMFTGKKQTKNGELPWPCPCRTRFCCCCFFVVAGLKWNLCEKNFDKKKNVVALEMHTADWRWTHDMGERESEWLAQCEPKGVKEKLYSEQYKRYNLSRGHDCGRAGSETAVRTALIYHCIHSSLNTKTVHSVQRCWSMKYCCRAGLARNQGRRQPLLCMWKKLGQKIFYFINL